MPRNKVSTPERLAYWYLRLNGYMTIENFVIHPDRGANQRTDADLLGVRFASRAENIVMPMKDDPNLIRPTSYADVVIAEVKKGLCALNGPWTNPDQENIQRILSAIGVLPKPKRDSAAKSLYENGQFQDQCVSIRMIAIGDRKAELTPAVTQILFDKILDFIHGRFAEYERQKASVGNWAPDGQHLRRLFASHRNDLKLFREGARGLFDLPQLKTDLKVTGHGR